jgi:hypothetical protein
MSDINPKVQAATGVEAGDLSDLAASKNLREGISIAPANSTDLATASISSADVMRVSQRSDIRRAVQDRITPQQATVELTNGRSRSTLSKSSDTTAVGIFKNPFYRYDGGLLNKVLALIGNILKALERIFLRLLGARDTSPTPHQTQPTRAKSDGVAAESQEKQKLDQQKRKELREQAELVVKRQ